MAFDDAAGRYAAENANLVAYDSAVVYTEPAATTQATTEASYQPAVEATTANVITTATSGYQAVVDYALQFVGNPYVWGGSSLTNGTDCSGFTMSVYANFGYSLPHSSAMQATRGTEVDLSAVSPGDLIFYKNGGSTIGHVALYIGNGQVVHASTSTTGIIVSNMYYSTPCKAVRIVN
jgi:cell wall-associated NlpC family hydrolase